MTCSVTKATTIHFIVGKCHVKKRKSCKTALSGHYAWLSFDLLSMPLRADTDTYINVHGQNNFKKTGMHGLQAQAHLVKKRLALCKPLLFL